MISLYTTIFNLQNFDFSINEALSNWLFYTDEVVISTLEDQLEEIQNEVNSGPFADKVKIVSSDVDIKKDGYWVGGLKDLSLKNCSHDIVIQADFDERLSGKKEIFIEIENILRKSDISASILLPVIDLYADLDHYSNIGRKWYMHKKQGSNRGPVNFGIKEDGSIDDTKSDTCELINDNGDLLPSIGFVDFTYENPKIIHLGYLNIDRRNKINKNFWTDMWKLRTKDKEKEIRKETFDKEDPNKRPHSLPKPLWPTL